MKTLLKYKTAEIMSADRKQRSNSKKMNLRVRKITMKMLNTYPSKISECEDRENMQRQHFKK